jgi:hypothetical protein
MAAGGRYKPVFAVWGSISMGIFSISRDSPANKVKKQLKKYWHAVCLKGFILGFGHVPPKF